MEQVQNELKVEDGAVAARREMAAELAEEQRVRGGACRCGDVGCNLGTAADPVMDVVTEVSPEVTAVG